MGFPLFLMVFMGCRLEMVDENNTGRSGEQAAEAARKVADRKKRKKCSGENAVETKVRIKAEKMQRS